MPRNWEAWFQTAAQPASATEEEERDRTVARIGDAIDASTDIPNGSVSVFVKGSYKTNTNVRRDSDVDVCVEWQSAFHVHTWGETTGLGPTDLNYTPATPDQTIEPDEFRRRVEQALIRSLGAAAVDTAGDKAIDVAAGSTTLEADVIPCQLMRRYDTRETYVEGQRIFPKSGGHIDNYPQQNYDNGVAKNGATNGRYKKIVRCFKKLETEMFEEGRIPRDYPGYLIECLLYNVPNSSLEGTSLSSGVIGALRWLLEATNTQERGDDLKEVNELLMLFRGRADRSVANANAFVTAVIDRLVED
jgi:hypothetical protein